MLVVVTAPEVHVNTFWFWFWFWHALWRPAPSRLSAAPFALPSGPAQRSAATRRVTRETLLLLLFSATSPHESARTRRAPYHRAHRSPCPVHTCIEIPYEAGALGSRDSLSMPDLWHTYINALQHLAIKKKQAAGHGACRDCLLDVSARSSRQHASERFYVKTKSSATSAA